MRIVTLKIPFHECLEPFAKWFGWACKCEQVFVEPHEYDCNSAQQNDDIVLGAHVYPFLIRQNIIIYNTENFMSNPVPWYYNWKQSERIWSYSPLAEANWTHAPLGYVPELWKDERKVIQDIDVLHYGSVNERRSKILTELANHGLRVRTLFDIFGKTLNEFIDRSKVILNAHFYEPGLFEQARVIPCMHRGALVMSEHSIDDDGSLAGNSTNIVEDVLEAFEKDRLDSLRDQYQSALRKRPFIYPKVNM